MNEQIEAPTHQIVPQCTTPTYILNIPVRPKWLPSQDAALRLETLFTLARTEPTSAAYVLILEQVISNSDYLSVAGNRVEFEALLNARRLGGQIAPTGHLQGIPATPPLLTTSQQIALQEDDSDNAVHTSIQATSSVDSGLQSKENELHEAASLFPRGSDQELKELADDIRVNGLRNPIIVHEGKIIDGQRRREACKLAGCHPRYVEFTGTSDEVFHFVVSANIHRRHLTAVQRALIAARLIKPLEKEAEARKRVLSGTRSNSDGTVPHRQVVEKNPEPARARKIAAATVGVNERYVQDAKALIERAPKLVAEVEAKQLSLPAAIRQMKDATFQQALTEPNAKEQSSSTQELTVILVFGEYTDSSKRFKLRPRRYPNLVLCSLAEQPGPEKRAGFPRTGVFVLLNTSSEATDAQNDTTNQLPYKSSCWFMTLYQQGRVSRPDFLPDQILTEGWGEVYGVLKKMWPDARLLAYPENAGELPGGWEHAPI
jgi:ParB/RepB/Spo0J family partition protein